MKHPQSIVNIKNSIANLRETIDDFSDFKDGHYTDELHAHKELLNEIDNLLIDIVALARSPAVFSKLFSHDELIHICGNITVLQEHISDPDQLVPPFLDLQKTTRKILPERIIKKLTKQEISTLDLNSLTFTLQKAQKIRHQYSNLLTLLEEQQQELKEKLDTVDKQFVTSDQTSQKLTEKLDTAKQQLQKTNEIYNEITSFQERTGQQIPSVESFIEQIEIREKELEKQRTETQEYKRKLQEFMTEREEHLEKAKTLIEKAKTALGYTQATGISAAYKTRLDRLEKTGNWSFLKTPNTYWLAAAFSFSIVAIYLGWDFIQFAQGEDGASNGANGTSHSANGTSHSADGTSDGADGTSDGADGTLNATSIFARLSALTLPVTTAWFCASQYIKNKNIAEDYAYKTVLAQSIIGFSEQLKNNGQENAIYQEYIRKMLDEIHQHPLKNHKKHNTNNTVVPIPNLKKKKNTQSSEQEESPNASQEEQPR